MDQSFDMSSEKLPFEAAMDKVGFGLYGVLLTAVTAIILLGFSCIAYSTMFIVPTSACELATTPSQQGIMAAGPIAGLLLGGMIWSYLADARGRRVPLIVSLLFGAVFNIIGTISVNWVMLLIFQFLGSFCSSGLYSMYISLLRESVPMANRSTVVVIVSSFNLIAQGFMALLAIPIIPLRFSYYLPGLGIYWNSWRMLMLVFSIPHIVSAICLIFMQESPKFVFINGDENKALAILQAIHVINNWRVNEELQIDETPCSLDETSLLIVLSVGVIQAIFNSCVGYIINFVSRRNITIVLFLASGVSGIQDPCNRPGNDCSLFRHSCVNPNLQLVITEPLRHSILPFRLYTCISLRSHVFPAKRSSSKEANLAARTSRYRKFNGKTKKRDLIKNSVCVNLLFN